MGENKISKEDKVTLVGIVSFIVVGLLLYFVVRLEWYPTLVLSAVASVLVGLLAYKLLR